MHTIIRADLRATWDNGDAWGSCVGAHFSIADVLYVIGEDIPDEWQYRQPNTTTRVRDAIYNEDNGDWLAADLLESYYTNLITGDDLRHTGNVLSRYSDMLNAAGRSY